MSTYSIPMPELDSFHKKSIVINTLGTVRSFSTHTLLEHYLDSWIDYKHKYGDDGLDIEVSCIVNVCFNNCFRA